ncbi:MAG: DnaJ domain-containing protein [gamma proteobacterium symbiont of Taylorina sp.]|nr:DnaJ domain-containing protein [gamma proteobacterium symbiont of Taylorina sp.]
MANTDYYKTLGVKHNASDAEIKKQYRRLARKYHPDVSKLSNAEARFKEINEAYDVLKDKEKRSNYDHFGAAGANPFGGGFTPPPGGARSNFGGFGQGNFSDIFDNMFKNARGGQFNESTFSQQGASQQGRASKGENQTVKISVTLEDAYHGANRTINIHIPGESGNKKLKIKIPKGIKEGQKIRLSGQGSHGVHSKGDLLLEVSFAKHKHFTIDEKDISLILPITPWEAALGTSLSIPTLGGIVEMKLPENTKGGKKLRLKGRGLPGKHAGDQYVILQIMTPEADTDELKKLYKKMQDISQFNPREGYQ